MDNGHTTDLGLGACGQLLYDGKTLYSGHSLGKGPCNVVTITRNVIQNTFCRLHLTQNTTAVLMKFEMCCSKLSEVSLV